MNGAVNHDAGSVDGEDMAGQGRIFSVHAFAESPGVALIFPFVRLRVPQLIRDRIGNVPAVLL